MTNLFDLNGKIALVTGASRGIGESIARTLADAGAHVIVSSRKAVDCMAVVDAIKTDGGCASVFECNVGNMDDIHAIFNHIQDEFGKLDILVNNAAANPYFGPILDTPDWAFEKTVEVNLRGYFYMSVEAGKIMREQGSGSIINTASVNALQPGMHQGIYSVSKAAVVSMTKSFAKECGQFGIRVNALLPGLTKTKFAGALFENGDMYNAFLKQIPLGIHALPEQMAGTVLYLASDASSYTTGECIVVDGGLTI
ncbi:SDR family oxidoreductase [Temperatibacter marinus]|uniref:SDR family oxidoreductase n=1 Tax=Temperatibacter marinus TaxID=1456591 RepID=A0AA52H9B3_9PROT|nr:SDR family oxidoreductase [Temperatibacter marinus]WND03006.1 SDR family oxidoreductase [Temperatibacter marinus]